MHRSLGSGTRGTLLTIEIVAQLLERITGIVCSTFLTLAWLAVHGTLKIVCRFPFWVPFKFNLIDGGSLEILSAVPLCKVITYS